MPTHGDIPALPAYKQLMQVDTPPFRLGFEGDRLLHTDLPRTAAAVTIAGSCLVVAGASLPWIERAALGIALTRFDVEGSGIALPILASISALIALFVLLRVPATRPVAIVLVVLAVVELSLAIANFASIREAVALMNSRQVWAKVIGTGAYASVLGAAMILAGGVLAWMKCAHGMPAGNAEDTWR